MGFFGKLKGLINVSEEEFIDDIDNIDEEEYEEEESQDVRSSFSFNRKNDRDGKVVDIRSGSPAPTSARAKVVITKLDRYEDVTPVADIINEKKISLLNLESCDHNTAVRILDFITGVAYANNATVKRTAARAYVISPASVPLSGDIAEEIENMNY